MIVVVDDLRLFRAFPATYARTSSEAVELLTDRHSRKETIDELWLDHDLGGGDDINPVVNWIMKHCVWNDRPRIEHIVVHTSNPVGAAMITRSLQRWYQVTRVSAADYQMGIIDD